MASTAARCCSCCCCCCWSRRWSCSKAKLAPEERGSRFGPLLRPLPPWDENFPRPRVDLRQCPHCRVQAFSLYDSINLRESSTTSPQNFGPKIIAFSSVKLIALDTAGLIAADVSGGSFEFHPFKPAEFAEQSHTADYPQLIRVDCLLSLRVS